MCDFGFKPLDLHFCTFELAKSLIQTSHFRKVSFKLDVIHDIPPGIDHTGHNRAPLYNVGDIMKEFSGDVYDDDGKSAEYRYKKGTTSISNYNKKD